MFLLCFVVFEVSLSVVFVVLNLLLVSIILLFLIVNDVLSILLLLVEVSLFVFVEVVLLTYHTVFDAVECLEISLENFN